MRRRRPVLEVRGLNCPASQLMHVHSRCDRREFDSVIRVALLHVRQPVEQSLALGGNAAHLLFQHCHLFEEVPEFAKVS